MDDVSDNNAPADDPLGIVGRVIDNRYAVDALVDQGGFGYVYRAQHVMWDKPVAMKFFKNARDGKARETMKVAFIKEGALMSELSRKTTSIVQSRDIGEYITSDGSVLLYMVLEWLEGKTLDKLLKEERRAGASMWPLHRVMRTMAPVAEALDVAHANGVAHRDIKPSNVFIAQEDGRDVVKVLDFGIAKVVEGLSEGFAETGAHKNAAYTPAYAAPEQIARRHGATGPWTDVYALALVCVELLAGRHPIRASNFGQLVFAACDVDKRPTPTTCGCELGDDVEAVFLRALSVKASERFSSVRAFWEALLNTKLGQRSLEELRGLEDHHNLPPFLAATVSGEQPNSSSLPVPPSKKEPLLSKPMVLAVAALAVVAGGLVALDQAAQSAPPKAASPAAPVSNPTRRAASSLALSPRPPVLKKAFKRRDSSEIDKEGLARFSPLPAAVTDASNPATESKVNLGRRLFYEKRLSRRGDLACNSCHRLANYGVDGQALSVGNGGKKMRRNTLSVYHAAGAFALGWDGRSSSVEDQASLSITDPEQMAMTQVSVATALRTIPAYVAAFRDAFPDDGRIDLVKVARAIAAFERKLVAPSPWDAFLDGKSSALNEQQKRGFNTFVDVGCVQCHFGTYVGLSMYQKLGLVNPWQKRHDRGRFEVTKREADEMVFRVPSLRNVAKTAPYFHDGSESSLPRAVERMAKHQLGRQLDPRQIEDIVAWLNALTGTLPLDDIKAPEPYK